MSFDEKLASVVSLIKQHNEALRPPGTGGTEHPNGYVDPDDFVQALKATGGTDEDALKRMKYEEIAIYLPMVKLPSGQEIAPILLAKKIAAVFREGQTEESSSRPVTSRRAEVMTHEELVRAFDAQDYDNAVGRRLKSVSRGEPFLVFESGRIVNVPVSLRLLNEIRQGISGRDRVDVGGVIKPVFRVGELPDVYVDENPLYPGRPLRLDDESNWAVCDQTGRSWWGVSMEVRQLLRLATETGELKTDIDSVNNAIDMALRPTALVDIRRRYQKAALKFEELKTTNSLPKLTIPMSTKRGDSSLRGGRKVILG